MLRKQELITTVEEEEQGSRLPEVDVKNLHFSLEPPIGEGRHHLVYEINYQGRRCVYRMLKPTLGGREDIVETSQNEVQALFELPQKLDAINEELNDKLAELSIPVTIGFYADAPIAAVEKNGEYIGSIVPLHESGVDEKVIYLNQMYNYGYAHGYKLTLDRWEELRDCGTKQELLQRLAEYEEGDRGPREEAAQTYSEKAQESNKLSQERGDVAWKHREKQNAYVLTLESPEIAALQQELDDLKAELQDHADQVRNHRFNTEPGKIARDAQNKIIEAEGKLARARIREALKHQEYIQMLAKEQKELAQVDEKMEALKSGQAAIRKEGFEHFQRLAKRIQGLLTTHPEKSLGEILSELNDDVITPYQMDYEDMFNGIAIFIGLDILAREGFFADIEGGNLRMKTEIKENGKRKLSIHLMDVSKPKDLSYVASAQELFEP